MHRCDILKNIGSLSSFFIHFFSYHNGHKENEIRFTGISVPLSCNDFFFSDKTSHIPPSFQVYAQYVLVRSAESKSGGESVLPSYNLANAINVRLDYFPMIHASFSCFQRYKGHSSIINDLLLIMTYHMKMNYKLFITVDAELNMQLLPKCE